MDALQSMAILPIRREHERILSTRGSKVLEEAHILGTKGCFG